jgi:hypothetical protein
VRFGHLIAWCVWLALRGGGSVDAAIKVSDVCDVSLALGLFG